MKYKQFIKYSGNFIIIVSFFSVLACVIFILSDNTCENYDNLINLFPGGIDRNICNNEIYNNDTMCENGSMSYFSSGDKIIYNKYLSQMGKFIRDNPNKISYNDITRVPIDGSVLASVIYREKYDNEYAEYSFDECSNYDNRTRISIYNTHINITEKGNHIFHYYNNSEYNDDCRSNNLFNFFDSDGFLAAYVNTHCENYTSDEKFLIINYYPELYDNYIFAFLIMLMTE